MAFMDGTCKLCLKKYENFEDETTRSALNVLLPKIDLSLIQESIVCKTCAKMVIKCSDFKVKCLQAYEYIIPFVNEDNAQLDLKDVYVSRNAADVPQDEEICGLCMGPVKNCSAIYLGVEDGEVMLMKMIGQCFPELDLSIIKKPVICRPCHSSLENCLLVEEKIKKYCETLDVNGKDRIELRSVVNVTMRDVTAGEVSGNFIDAVKVETQFCEEMENTDEREIGGGSITPHHNIKLEQMFFHDNECANENIENEYENFTEFDNQKAREEESNKPGAIKIEEMFCGENEIKHSEENLEMEDQKILINEELGIKTDEHYFDRVEESNVLPQSEVITRLHGKNECLMSNLKRDPSEPNVECTLKNKSNVHLPSEITMYNCASCSYQTNHKRYLKQHLLKHKKPSKVKMYKCDFCFYQAARKYSLRIHLQEHKDPSEVTMYKCGSCSFQTKREPYLRYHLLKHKDPSEVKMYKCDFCSFQTRHKGSLNIHSRKHKDLSEGTMYKCDCCSFQTKRTHYLKYHSLVNKDPSEVKMYKCDSCSFETKFKASLTKHKAYH